MGKWEAAAREDLGGRYMGGKKSAVSPTAGEEEEEEDGSPGMEGGS